MKSRKRWIVGGALGVLACASLACWLWWEREERQFREDVAALKAMGIPTTPDELRALSGGTGTNGAGFYRQANQLWEDVPHEESGFLWNPKAGLDPEDRASILEKHAATEKRIISLLQQASRADFVDFELPWEKPDPTAELTPLYVYPHVLVRRISDSVEEGDTSGAIEDFRILVKLLDHLYEVPTQAAMRGAAGDSELNQFVEPLLTASQDRSQELAEIVRILKARKSIPPIQVIAKAEYVEQVSLLHAITDFSHLSSWPSGEERQGPKPIDRLAVTPFGKRVVERSLASTWRRFWESAPSDPAEYRGFNKSIEEKHSAIRRAKEESLSGYAVSKLLGEGIPVYDYPGAVTSRRLAVAATEALLARAAGQEPRAILVGSRPELIDEHSGKPFGFKMDDQELLIYAFGPDKVDDLGRTKRDSKNRSVDIPIRIKLKPIPTPKASTSRTQ